MVNKRFTVVCRATYRGVQILESMGKFMLYLGAYRHEFDSLPQATQFINDWHKLKEN